MSNKYPTWGISGARRGTKRVRQFSHVVILPMIRDLSSDDLIIQWKGSVHGSGSQYPRIYTGYCPNKKSFERSLKGFLLINLGEAED